MASQNAVAQNVRLGPKVGLKLANISDLEGSRLGYECGLVLDIPVKKNLGFQSGIVVNAKGNDNFKTTYLEIPLTLTLKRGTSTKSPLLFQFGTYGGVLVFNKKSVDRRPTPQMADFGVHLAFGIEASNVQFLINFQQGLALMFEGETNSRHQNFGITMAFLFPALRAQP